MAKTIKPKDKDTILRALRSGVVPRTGLQHIQVGRYNEIRSFLGDIEAVAAGGSSFRLVIGEYGAGKTFFLSLVRQIATEKGLVTMNADLSPAKRLHGREGQSRTLLSDLVASMSTRTRPDGGALPMVLERLLSRARQKAEDEDISLMQACDSLLSALGEYPGGYAFAKVVSTYCGAYDNGNDRLAANAMRWLRCEYSTKTDALREVGVRDYINDHSFFDTLVLYSILVRQAGYKGLYVCLDEMVNLYKIVNAASRKANYEEVLNLVNSTLQGTVQGLGIVLSGTPEFLTDTSRGLYSYEALRSRLAENSFSKSLGLSDFDSTVLRLPNLTPEEMYLLLQKLRDLMTAGDDSPIDIPDEAIKAYLHHCAVKIGESYFRTPRNTLKGFIDLMSILKQYPDRRWQDLIDEIEVAPDREPSALDSNTTKDRDDDIDESFASLRL